MILITRPLYDKTTHYLFYWSQRLVEEASPGVFDIAKHRVTRKIVESFLKKKNPAIVIFNGHGNASSMAGQNDEVLISADNADILKDKNVYMRACEAGRELGVHIVRSGAKGFIGYKESFMFPYDKDKVSRPIEDEIAQPCLECSNQVGLDLIRGMTVGNAHAESLKMFQERIDALSTSKTPPYQIWFLQWNMINQVCFE